MELFGLFKKAKNVAFKSDTKKDQFVKNTKDNWLFNFLKKVGSTSKSAYETFLHDTVTDLAQQIQNDKKRQLKAISDSNLTHLITELELQGKGLAEKYSEYYPKILKIVQKNRKKAEERLLQLLPKHNLIEKQEQGRKVLSKRKINADYQTIFSEKGNNIFIDDATGYFDVSAPGWWGPSDFTACGAYQFIRDKMSFDEFINEASKISNISKEKLLNMEPTDTDKFWIVLGNKYYFYLTGKMGQRSWLDDIELEEGEYDKIDNIIDSEIERITKGKGQRELSKLGADTKKFFEEILEKLMDTLKKIDKNDIKEANIKFRNLNKKINANYISKDVFEKLVNEVKEKKYTKEEFLKEHPELDKKIIDSVMSEVTKKSEKNVTINIEKVEVHDGDVTLKPRELPEVDNGGKVYIEKEFEPEIKDDPKNIIQPEGKEPEEGIGYGGDRPGTWVSPKYDDKKGELDTELSDEEIEEKKMELIQWAEDTFIKWDPETEEHYYDFDFNEIKQIGEEMNLTEEQISDVINELKEIVPEIESNASLNKSSRIRKTPNKNEWCVIAESGRSMGCYDSKKKAEERLKQVEMFKHMKASDQNIENSKSLHDFKFGDRIKLKTDEDIEGTVLEIQDTKPGDIDLLVFFDQPQVEGETIIEVNPTEVIKIGEASEEQKDRAKNAFKEFEDKRKKYEENFEEKVESIMENKKTKSIEKKIEEKAFLLSDIGLLKKGSLVKVFDENDKSIYFNSIEDPNIFGWTSKNKIYKISIRTFDECASETRSLFSKMGLSGDALEKKIDEICGSKIKDEKKAKVNKKGAKKGDLVRVHPMIREEIGYENFPVDKELLVTDIDEEAGSVYLEDRETAKDYGWVPAEYLVLVPRRASLNKNANNEEIIWLDYNEALDYFDSDPDWLEFLNEYTEDEKDNFRMYITLDHDKKIATFNVGSWDGQKLPTLTDRIDNTTTEEDDYNGVMDFLKQIGKKSSLDKESQMPAVLPEKPRTPPPPGKQYVYNPQKSVWLLGDEKDIITDEFLIKEVSELLNKGFTKTRIIDELIEKYPEIDRLAIQDIFDELEGAEDPKNIATHPLTVYTLPAE